AYLNYRRRDSSFLPMEACVNPSHRRLRPRKWEASPFTAGSSH
ncbi:transposase, partial [Photorhabdus sp. S8-52]